MLTSLLLLAFYPSGTDAAPYFTLNGVEYLVIAEGAAEAAPEIASGEFVRAFSGRLLSSASGRIRRWTVPLASLTPEDHATLRSAIREGRRASVSGQIVGPEPVAVTASIASDDYERADLGHLRAPVLTLRAVRPS